MRQIFFRFDSRFDAETASKFRCDFDSIRFDASKFRCNKFRFDSMRFNAKSLPKQHFIQKNPFDASIFSDASRIFRCIGRFSMHRNCEYHCFESTIRCIESNRIKISKHFDASHTPNSYECRSLNRLRGYKIDPK